MGLAYLIPGMCYVNETGSAAPPPDPPPSGDCPTLAEIVAAIWDPVNALAAGSALRQLADNGTEVYDRTTDSLQATRDNSPTIQQVVDAIFAEIHARTA